MAEQVYEIEATTDQNGYFGVTKVVDPENPLFVPDINVTVELRAKLISPEDVEVTGTLDIDAEDGNPSNMGKSFTMKSDEEISLGSWRISLGRNILVVRGSTNPKVANGVLRAEVRAIR